MKYKVSIGGNRGRGVQELRSFFVEASTPEEAYDLGQMDVKENENELVFEIKDVEKNRLVYDCFNDYSEIK